ncbi:hypothetical protein ACQKE8_13105 [Sphingobium limneticum]|uniref:hypothetical protein n=1 Tax=Sphingobium limneticum TaxID=1007511 RepID=UPI003D082BFF
MPHPHVARSLAAAECYLLSAVELADSQAKFSTALKRFEAALECVSMDLIESDLDFPSSDVE